MNGSHTHLLDAYLDGLLSADARSTFETELDRNPRLRQEVAMQRMIDGALRRLFVAPRAEESLAKALPAADESHAGSFVSPRAASRTSRLRAALTLAAALGIAAVAIYRLGGFGNGPGSDGRYVRTKQEPMDTIYQRKVAEGFHPEWKCEDDQEFVRSFRHQLFQPLMLMTPPAGLSMGGLGYCNTLSPYSMYMLAHVHNDKVIVFFDRLDADRNLPPLSDPRLKRFRRELGELVLYEVTPLDAPKFLPLFQIPPP